MMLVSSGCSQTLGNSVATVRAIKGYILVSVGGNMAMLAGFDPTIGCSVTQLPAGTYYSQHCIGYPHVLCTGC